MAPAISRATFSMKLRSTEPSGCGGVGTAMKITSDCSTPSAVLLGETRGGPAATFCCDQLLQARARRWDAARLQQLDLGRVVVHADDLVADFGEAGAGDQTDVAGADDGQFHFFSSFMGTVLVGTGVRGTSLGYFRFNSSTLILASEPSELYGLPEATCSK